MQRRDHFEEPRRLIMEELAELEKLAELEELVEATVWRLRHVRFALERALLDEVTALRGQIADLRVGLEKLGGPIEETDADAA